MSKRARSSHLKPLPLMLLLAASLASGAEVDPAVEAALKAAPASEARVLVRLAAQADLSDAAGIADWKARGREVHRRLRAAADASQGELLARLQGRVGAQRLAGAKRFWISNAIVLDADAATLAALAADPAVGSIVPEIKLAEPVLTGEVTPAAPAAVEWGVAKIRAPEVWSEYGTSGAGVVVANVDTGVRYDHAALVGQYRGNLGGGVFQHDYNWFNPEPSASCPNPGVPCDDNGHGTHTMGTIVGSDGGANQVGVAPGARWIAAYGCCPSNEALLLAQEFMLAPTRLDGSDPDPDLRPQVVSQSWGGPGGSQIFEDVAAALHASGIFTVFAAGNEGSGCATIGSPGDSHSVIAIGATTSSDAIASFSSRGPNPFGGIGPTVSAPGSSIRSSTRNGGYGSSSGTSMATPHVAGAVALLLSVEPRLTGRLDEIEALLEGTAVPLTSGQSCGGVPGSAVPNNTFGWGRIDVKAAADMIAAGGWIEGRVTVGGVPTAGVPVSYMRLGKTIVTHSDALGHYRVLAGEGPWSMSASHLGQTVAAPNIEVVADQTTVQDFAIASEAPIAVAGQVSPAAPVMVTVLGHESVPPVWADATGHFSIDVPAPGAELQFVHPGFATQIEAVAGNAGETRNLNVNLSPIANYQCRDNRAPGGPTYAWTDATGGSSYALGDDGSTPQLALPGTFTWFGNDFTSVRANANGFAFFGTTTYDTVQMVLPFEGRPNNDAMALGDDMNPESGSQGMVYVETRGDTLVIQYDQVEHWASGFPETFQILLDTTADTVTYQYNTLSWPDFTTVGLENANGSAGQLYSYRNSAALEPGRAVQFSPASGADVDWGCDHAFTLTAADDRDPVLQGGIVTYRLRWHLVGFGGAREAELAAAIPAGTSFVDAAGGIAPAGGELHWTLGNLRARSQGELWFRVRADVPGTTSTTATLVDADGQARSATATTLIQAGDSIFADDFEWE